MEEATARLDLPMMQPGQAQKEMTHNEALARLDLVAQASVVESGVDEPPSAPQPGECWIIGAAPTGDWAGHAGVLAGWTAGGWRFVAPTEGMSVWDCGAGLPLRWTAGGWMRGTVRAERVMIGGQQVVGPRRSAIADPVGGATMDVEARQAIGSILAALAAHGLVEG